MRSCVLAVAHWTLARKTAATRLANSFTLNETEISNLLTDVKHRMAAGANVDDASHAAACSWIIANENAWGGDGGWLDEPEDTLVIMYAAVSTLVFFVLWFFIIEPVRSAPHHIHTTRTRGAKQSAQRYTLVPFAHIHSHAYPVFISIICNPRPSQNFFRCTDYDGDAACTMKGTTVWGWDLLGLIWRTRRKRRAKRVVKPQAVVHTSGMPDVAAAKLNEINGPCVTLQQREMLVRKMDATVPITITRLDSMPTDVTVGVRTVDQSATIGKDHQGLSVGVWDSSNPTPAVSITMAAGEKQRVVHLHLSGKSKYYEGIVRFYVQLDVAPGDTSTDERPQIYPVDVTRVTVLDLKSFPNSLEFEWDEAALLRDADRFGDLLAHGATQNLFTGGIHQKNIGIEDVASTTFAASVESLKLANTAMSSATKEVFDFSEAWHPVWHYLKEAVRWCWKVPGFPVPKPVTFALAGMVSQSFNGLVSPLIYSYWINGLTSGNPNYLRLEVTLTAACAKMCMKLWDFRTPMLYSGRWDVQRRLQMALIRKYLSLDPVDLEDIPEVEERFREAISTTAVDLSNKAFIQAHNVIYNVFGVIFSTAYLWWQVYGVQPIGGTVTDSIQIGVHTWGSTLGLLVFMVVILAFFITRAKTNWRMWKKEYEADIALQQGLTFILARATMVKRTEREEDVLAGLYKSITDSLWGVYGLWLHQYVTTWWLNAVYYLVLYGLWAVGPMLISSGGTVGQLLALLDVISVLFNSVISLLGNITQLYTSGMMVLEVAGLLNYETRAVKQLKAKESKQHAQTADGDEPLHIGGKEFAVQLQDATIGPKGEAPILKMLNIYAPPEDLTTLQRGAIDVGALVKLPPFIPAGGIIAVSTPGGEDRSARMLLSLFAGVAQPDSGVAQCLSPLAAELVTNSEDGIDVMRSSLQRNLTYALSKEAAHALSDKALWELCRRCGMSKMLLGGDEYKAGWARKVIKPHSHRHFDDLGKILIVRALLQRPDVLILDHVSTLWSLEHGAELGVLMRQFIDGTLDDCLGRTRAASSTKRSVLWCTSDAAYEAFLRPSLVDGDLELTIHSASVATLTYAKPARRSASPEPLPSASPALLPPIAVPNGEQ